MAAARDLDMVRTGTAPVRIEVLRPGDPPPVYLIQLGSFREYANARNPAGPTAQGRLRRGTAAGDRLTRVVIPGLDAGAAAQVQQRLRERGFPEGLRRVANR